MNNEQNNNSIFGIPNQATPVNNQPASESVIPGANLNPIGATPAPSVAPQPTTPASMPTVEPIQPTPEVTTTTPINNIPQSDNIINVNANSVIPELAPSTPITSVTAPIMEPTNNLNQEIKVDNPSPFDIGINSNPLNTEQTKILDPIMPVGNSNPTPTELYQPLNNNMATPTNNLGDSTPLANQSNNTSNNNDNIVPVKTYLGYIVLFAIPVVGIIMLFVKAFSDKKDKNISNFAKAQLIWLGIGTVISIIIAVLATYLTVKGITGSIENDYYDYNYNTNYDYGYNYDYDYDY